MRITYLHQHFVRPSQAGGTRSFEMGRRLVAAGHHVDLITADRDPHSTNTGWTDSEECGISVHTIPVAYANSMEYTQRIRSFLKFALFASFRASRLPCDVVFATSTPLTIIIPAFFAALANRAPLVFEVRDLWPEVPIAIGALRNPLMRWMARGLEWFAYRVSTRVVALSPGIAAGIRRRGVSQDRIVVIPNGSDRDLFSVSPSAGAEVRERLGLAAGQPLIVYAGTFGTVNDVSYLVDLAFEMQSIDPNVHFLLVGEGKEKSDVARRAMDLGVTGKNLTIWPPLSKEGMPAVFAAATVVTSVCLPLPAIRNNSANKFFDGLAAGKPIAINYLGWQADLLQSSGAGVVLPYDRPDLAARTLAGLVSSDDRLRSAAIAASALARDRFDRDALAADLEQVLRSVTDARPAAGPSMP